MYTTTEIRQIIHNCNSIKEIYKVSEILQYCIDERYINCYYRQMIINCTCLRIQSL